MKNILNKVVLASLVLLALAATTKAANREDAETNQADGTDVSAINVGGANTNACINLFYVGTSSDAAVTISATAMTVYAPSGSVDTTVGTSGVITYSSTLGANTIDGLCAYFNGLRNNSQSNGSNYVCRKVNCKGNDTPGVMLKTQTAGGASNLLNAAGGFDITQTTITSISLGIQPAPGKRVVLKSCQVRLTGATAGAPDKLYVYGRLRKHGNGWTIPPGGVIAGLQYPNNVGNVPTTINTGVASNDTFNVWASSTAIASGLSTNAAGTVVPSDGLSSLPWLEFDQDAHVVVRGGISDGSTDAAQTAANYVSCRWKEK